MIDSRLQKSKIMLIGMTGMAAEIAKNLVLAGVYVMSIVDDQLASIVIFIIESPDDGAYIILNICYLFNEFIFKFKTTLLLNCYINIIYLLCLQVSEEDISSNFLFDYSVSIGKNVFKFLN